ncbi:hypothetical protein LG289_07165 [Planococcus rifietoensis]
MRRIRYSIRTIARNIDIGFRRKSMESKELREKINRIGARFILNNYFE